MKKILIVLKNTLIRGILFLGPLLVVLVIADHVIIKLKELANPIADLLPYHSVLGIGKAYWAVFLILLCIGFILGIIARLKIAADFLKWLEENLLSRLPGYVFMKQMAESIIGIDDTTVYKVVLFSIEDAWQLAYLVEEIDDEIIAVYVPSVPNPGDGDLFYVSKTRIKEVNISYRDSIKILNGQGRRSKKFLQGKF